MKDEDKIAEIVDSFSQALIKNKLESIDSYRELMRTIFELMLTDACFKFSEDEESFMRKTWGASLN